MTIQNIEDVMDRIMSLNRNLNEESLRTLLSASGWDKGDIIEGIRIFKVRAGGMTNAFSPIVNTPSPDQSVKIETQPIIQQENYSFNIKPKEEEKVEEAPLIVSEIKEPSLIVPETKDVKKENISLPTPIIEEDLDKKPKKTLPAKIFTIILILILIVLSVLYMYPNLFSKVFNSFEKENIQSQTVNIQTQNIPNTKQKITENDFSSSTDTISDNLSSTTLDNLLKEVSSLRSELNSYKEASQSSKTIVKYISQKGAAGKNGRGIVSVSATSTGFIINYTDNTTTVIPYSTTTILNIINSNSVCFRDVSSSTFPAINDICLNREAVSKLIASSSISH